MTPDIAQPRRVSISQSISPTTSTATSTMAVVWMVSGRVGQTTR